MKKVIVLYKFLPQWRIDFFNKLRIALLANNITLELIYGKMKGPAASKMDEVECEWGKFVGNKFIKLGEKEFIWQPATKFIKDADLVIVEQANKLLINYYLILRKILAKKKIAFWGHGLNLQDNPDSLSNKFKRIYSTKTDWWFAYTEGVKKKVMQFGFPEEKITVLNNTIDTSLLLEEYNRLKNNKIADIKRKYNIGEGPVGLFCGGMYKEKRLDFLIESCKRIRNEIKNFEMIFIGGGPDSIKISTAAKKYEWIHYLGPLFNEQRVPFFYMSDIFLMPGLVGLAIIDSFAMQTPMITTNFKYHSPEIEYLKNDYNGIMTENDIDAYTKEVINLLSNKNKLDELKINCKKSIEKYSLDHMVENFKEGVLKCLDPS
jgi:glycosyltransferase involved in cell wall biosynthesis